MTSPSPEISLLLEPQLLFFFNLVFFVLLACGEGLPHVISLGQVAAVDSIVIIRKQPGESVTGLSFFEFHPLGMIFLLPLLSLLRVQFVVFASAHSFLQSFCLCVNVFFLSRDAEVEHFKGVHKQMLLHPVVQGSVTVEAR